MAPLGVVTPARPGSSRTPPVAAEVDGGTSGASARDVLRERAILSAYVVALLAFGAIAITVFVQFGHLGEQGRWVQHTHQVLTKLEYTLSELKDVETGQRGYLVTGQDVLLEPYAAAVGGVHQHLRELDELTADNTQQQQRLTELRPVIDRKLRFAAETIALARAGDRRAAHDRVAGLEGKQAMDDIRRRVADLQLEERRLLDDRLRRAETTAWRTTALLVFGNAFGFTALAAGTILLGRELNHRKRLEQELAFRDRRTALEELAQGAQRNLQSVVDEMPLGILLVDAETRSLVLTNACMQSLYGAQLRTASGKFGAKPPMLRRADRVPLDASEEPLTRALERGEAVHAEELQLVRADGSGVHVLVDAAPVRAQDGRITGAISVLRERDEVRRNEEDRRRAAQFRDVFVGALGHDLRNPLTVMTAGAAALARRASTPEEAKIVARMSSSAERMGRMIGQLLDFTEARLGGSIPLDPQRTDLGSLAQSVLERLDVVYPDRTFDLRVTGELAGVWDPARIEQVVEQLVVNAVEHGRHDAPVRVAARSTESEAFIEVSNEGNPIPDELRPLVFDPFRRAAERRRMKSIGLGIGLYLAAQIVHGHGGKIDVESSAERGTVFRVALPKPGS